MVSGVAFGALLAQATLEMDLDGLFGPAPARADITAVEEPAAPAVEAAPAAQPTPPPPTPPELELPEPAAPEPAPTNLVEAPDLTRTTALAALRRARRAGFEVEIHDSEGARVPPSERRFMRVGEGDQSPAPGTLVEPGATLELTADYPNMGFAAGY